MGSLCSNNATLAVDKDLEAQTHLEICGCNVLCSTSEGDSVSCRGHNGR